jgi:hypothetical protein
LGKSKKILVSAVIIGVFVYGFLTCGFGIKGLKKTSAETKDSYIHTVVSGDSANYAGMQKVVFKIDGVEELDAKVEEYLRDTYPIISDEEIQKIQSAKWINVLANDSLGIVNFFNFYVPKNTSLTVPRDRSLTSHLNHTYTRC